MPRLVGLISTFMLLAVSSASTAQEVTRRSVEPQQVQPSPKTVQVPAPDWLVWNSFYVGIMSQISDPAGQVQQLLADKLGISGSALERFMSLSEAYVREVSRLLAMEKSEVAKRSMAALVPTASTRLHININETLARDGTTARFEASKNAALADHREQLAELLGSEGLERVSHWLDAEVRNHIRVFKLDIESLPATAQ